MLQYKRVEEITVIDCVEHGGIEKQHNQCGMEVEMLEVGLARLAEEVPGEAPHGLGEKHWYVVILLFVITASSPLAYESSYLVGALRSRGGGRIVTLK